MVINVADKYKCDECGETFRLKANYDNHLRIHKEKKFKQMGDFEIKINGRKPNGRNNN